MAAIKLPPPSRELQESYLKLISRLEETISDITSSCFSDVLNCKPGCSDCCIEFSIFPFEAAMIVNAEHTSSFTLHSAGRGKKCCFLQEDLCQIYLLRPVICRTQGLPIGYVDEERQAIEVSACPLNFADDYQFTGEELLFLDSFNSELARLNERYCRTFGTDPKNRIALSEISVMLGRRQMENDV